MNKSRNIFWGVTFILAAALVVLNSLGYLGGINMFSLVIGIVLIPVIITNIIHLEFFGIFVPIALLGIIFSRQLGIEQFTPLPILIVAVLLSIGLSFIFPRKKYCHENSQYVTEEEISGDGDVLNFETSFNGSVKYVTANDIKMINIDSSFSGLKLYLDNADICGDCANVNVNMNFAGVEMFVPRTWNVIDNVKCSLGGVEMKGIHSDIKTKSLILNGKINLSGITIIYV